MKYNDLRDFVSQLEKLGELKRITAEVDPHLEMTEICDRTLRAGGPALLFENVKGHDMPLLGNLFGTPKRVALGMGQDSVEALREKHARDEARISELLADGRRTANDVCYGSPAKTQSIPYTIRTQRAQEECQ